MSDLLSWDKFFEDYKNRKNKIITKITDFNRLVLHSENFFCIAGYGAFVPGYFIILTKELIPSFANIKKEQFEELNLFIDFIKHTIKKLYKKDMILFEHGMCSCVGGLDRAHIHLMPVNQNISELLVQKKIDLVLKRRCAGIDEVTYLNTKINHPHDIKHIMNEVSEDNLKIKGKILNFKTIQNLKLDKWPLDINNKVDPSRTYIYFNAGKNKSFLTLKNIETQLGREIAFEIELIHNIKLKRLLDKNLSENSFKQIWRWQDFRFDKDILKTLLQTKKFFSKNSVLLDKHKLINVL